MVNKASALCLRRNGTSVVVATCSASASEKWAVRAPVSPHPVAAAALVNAAWQRCLDAASSLLIAPCTDSKAQTWTIDPFQRLRAADTGRCLDGGTVSLVTCSGSGGQLWTLLSTGGLRNDASGECLKAPGGSVTTLQRLVLAACTSDPRRRWTVG